MFINPPPARSEDLYRVTLLRHGQSEGNERRILQGQSEYPLSGRGQDQARALADRWKREGVSFTLAITSPLARARQTAEIIAEAIGCPIEENADWMERNNGRLAGLRPEQIEAQGMRPPFIHIYQPVGEIGESQWELYLRAGRAIQDLLRRPPGNYLIISHGGILNLAMYAILGIAPHANLQGPRFRFHNAAFARLEYHPTRHTWVVDAINDRDHWTGGE